MAGYDKNCWRTPNSFFNRLDDEFHFGMDAAAADLAISKCAVFIPPEVDALATDWKEYACLMGVSGSPVWINPPFNPMAPWADKVLGEFENGVEVVMLTNAATGTSWFRKLADKASQIRFTTGRIAFLHPVTGERVNGNTMAQAVFVFSHSVKYKEKVIWLDV